MGTTANKLNKILDSKAKIKAAIEAKGVTNVGDVLSEYPSKIEEISGGGFQIPTGTSFGYSKWESIPPEVITYINTTSGYYGLFYNAVIAYINPETVFIPSDCSQMFDSCRSKSGGGGNPYDKIILDCSRLERQQLYETFRKASDISEIELRNTENIFRYYDYSFYNCGARKITGIDMKSCTSSITSSEVFGNNWWLYFIEIKNLGYNSNFTALNMSEVARWGVENEEIPGSKQSLIDSLLTYSFDRASAGYSTCTITLSSYTKAALTSDEIAQITSKGYTIA